MNKRAMKRTILSVLMSLTMVSLFYFLAATVQAGSLAQSYIRLDRTKASTPSTGLVCALTPNSDNGAEADLQVSFPVGFSVGALGNWAVATSDIPNGATAWPGIGSATNVSEQTVTFPSSNLSANTLYCFRWTSSGALTNPSSETSNSGSVVTRTAGAATIDSGTFALPTTNDQMSVTATVPASSSDFQSTLTSSTSGQPYPQNQTISYTLTYGSTLLNPVNLRLEAEWSLGTIAGSGSPSVEILSYVSGSASNAYGSTAPVIDLVNRRISWDISSFPANTSDQTVTFQLRTTSDYTGSSLVSFDTKGRTIGPGTQTPDSTLSQTYKYVAVITPTPTPGPTNTPTPGPAPTSSTTATATPTPTTQPSRATDFQFTKIDVQKISADLVAFLVGTSQKSTITVRYGLSPNKLSSTINDTSSRTHHTISISPLEANTAYYFRMEAVNAAGRVIKSDIYLVTTARTSTFPLIDSRSLTVVSSNVILLQNSSQKKNLVVVPKNTAYGFRFSFEDVVHIEDLRISVRNTNVLGLFTIYAAPQIHENNTTIVETSAGQYNGLLKTSGAPGLYSVFIKTRDENGNLDEQNLFDVKVTEPMKVMDKKSKEPIQGAYVQLFIFSPTEQDYVPITPDMFPLSDSEFTDQNGEASYVLPSTRYLARISAPGYDNKEVEFTIGPNKGEALPAVYLTGVGFNPISIVTYYGAILWRECQSGVNSLQQFAASNNLFGFVAAYIMVSFIVLTFLSFRRKLKIPFSHMHLYFHHIVINSHSSNLPSHPTSMKLAEKEFMSVIFEYLLISSFILEIFFTAVFGPAKTALFLGLSLVNLIMWILHLVHEDKECGAR